MQKLTKLSAKTMEVMALYEVREILKQCLGDELSNRDTLLAIRKEIETCSEKEWEAVETETISERPTDAKPDCAVAKKIEYIIPGHSSSFAMGKYSNQTRVNL